jgi:hypothetical protein
MAEVTRLLVQIYLLVVIWLTNSNCQDEFLLIDNSEGPYYCITNSSYALSWIGETTDHNNLQSKITNINNIPV